MPSMPSQARSLTGFDKYGIDEDGEKMFFTFAMSGNRHATFLASHKGLANAIRYLQEIAQRAEERRLARSTRQSVQMLEKPSRVIRSGSIMPDVTGKLARLDATTPSGAPVDIQIEFDALVSLQACLPELIEKMRYLQEQRKGGPKTLPLKRGK